MRVLTWNINSLRLRLPLLEQVVKACAPDIICLQETKVEDALFPLEAVKTLGFDDVAFRGMKSYNGVMIAANRSFQTHPHLNWVGQDDARHLWVSFDNGVELHNFYVPAGGDEPDPILNPKYQHKLQFLEEMTAWFEGNRTDSHSIILVGDLNIAPLEHDVWSHRQLMNVVSHTQPELERLQTLQNSIKFTDMMRKFVPEHEKLYSWWSYRGRDWQKSDRGRRLDHIWASGNIAKQAKNMQVLKEFRGVERPSDHAPVFVDF